MPRGRAVPKRNWEPDPQYNSTLVTRFVNALMLKGKRSVAEDIFYKAMERIRERTGEDPSAVFNRAISNVKPVLEVKPRRVGGSTYQIPIEVPQRRRTALAIRWLIMFTRKRHEKTLIDKLAAELIDAANNTGATIKKKEDTHRMAEANKAFAHYRW
ncbi:MAG: 30S ribosomal protein S7 [Candidatus Coatesbacteria bacterium]|nr:MAG: 30S ribosomal protein S7 [Candidatus Coatesbacteria bacterium]